MRYFKFLLLAALLPFFLGCVEDLTATMPDDEETLSFRAEEMIVVPIKGHFTTIADVNSERIPVLPPETGLYAFSEGWLEGQATHLGNLNVQASPYEVTAAYFTGPTQVVQIVEGTLTGAQGDAIFYSVNFVSDAATGTSSGTVAYTGGTGKFEGVIGEATLSGVISGTLGDPNDPVTSTFTGEGILRIPK